MNKHTVFRSQLLNAAKKEKEKWEPERVAPISPTPQDLIDRVLADSEMSHISTFIDLGCGDGRWLVSAAKMYRCICWGVDIDTNRVSVSLPAPTEKPLPRIEILNSDFSCINLRMFSHVIIYLGRSANITLKRKLSAECSTGTIVVSVGFQLVGWTPVAVYSSSAGISAYKYIMY